ncbi:MAG: GspE/PulE family protein, partial [Vulcanococcus sp.]
MTASASTIPQRPVAEAQTPEQQRLEVELLLQEAVLTRSELGAAGNERWSWHPRLTQESCRDLGCLPVAYANNTLTVAVPTHWGAEQRQTLREACPEGPPLALRLALQGDLQTVLNQPPSPSPATPAAVAAPQETPNRISLFEDLKLEGPLEDAPEDSLSELDVEASLKASNASPVVSLVDRILVQALQRSASDIHLEPQDDGLLIRLRQDGVLEQLDKLPKNLTPAVTSRLKIMADLDIAERRLPQDGRIRRRYQGRLFDLRVSTLPTRYGEKVCMRLLDSGATHLGLDRLISEPTALASVREMGSKPFGMLLVTGPTGSGKSTTLYSLLAERNDPGVNISTVEDPIEYTLKGISQTQVNREKGYDFAMALRAF